MSLGGCFAGVFLYLGAREGGGHNVLGVPEPDGDSDGGVEREQERVLDGRFKGVDHDGFEPGASVPFSLEGDIDTDAVGVDFRGQCAGQDAAVVVIHSGCGFRVVARNDVGWEWIPGRGPE